MHFDCIIVGQGISGTWLSYFFRKAGLQVLVIDDAQKNAASRMAAGIINPVTGRRIVKTWMIDELLPLVWESYHTLGEELDIVAIEQKNIIDFFPTPQMKLAFAERFENDKTYLAMPADENKFLPQFRYDFGYGEIAPCYLVNLYGILNAWRKHLSSNNVLLEEKYEAKYVTLNQQSVRYKEHSADKIIFCDGVASASSSFFQNLPFAPNKGEVIWIEAPDLPATHIFKKGMNIVPWSDGIFWVGSSYEWQFEHDQPTETFRQKTTSLLDHWLKVPYKIIRHEASVRPATIERRPFIGFHPLQPAVGIFNGMGTKGCSLAPFFAMQMAEHLKTGSAIHPEGDIRRFTRILSR